MTTEYRILNPSVSVNGAYTPVEVLPGDAAKPVTYIPQPVVLVPLETVAAVSLPQQSMHYAAGHAIAAERDRRRRRDMAVCGLLDGIDLCLGWVPGIGQLLDLITACACLVMFGPKGLVVLLEMFDITGFVGAFVPTASLVCRSYWKEH
jgi:hypothetical protein